VVVMRNMTLSDMHSFTTCNCTSSVIAGQGPSQVTSANATEPGENNPPHASGKPRLCCFLLHPIHLTCSASEVLIYQILDFRPPRVLYSYPDWIFAELVVTALSSAKVNFSLPSSPSLLPTSLIRSLFLSQSTSGNRYTFAATGCQLSRYEAGYLYDTVTMSRLTSKRHPDLLVGPLPCPNPTH